MTSLSFSRRRPPVTAVVPVIAAARVARALLLLAAWLPLAVSVAGCDSVIVGPWFTAWAAPQHARETPAGLSNSTVRMILRPSISGHAVKVKLENTVGMAPVTFSAAYIGLGDGGAGVVPGSNKPLRFGGQLGVTLAPGAGAWSDPLRFEVKAMGRLVVSLDVDSATDASTHTLGLVTNYLAPGKRGAEPAGTGFAPVNPIAMGTMVKAYPVYWVAALDVASPETRGGIVAFGDSITDGRCSTTTGMNVEADLHQRWTDLLVPRLAALPAARHKAIANAGIVGNRVVVPGGNGATALERLDRDVLDRSGVTHVIFFEGTNDIFANATAEMMITSMKQVIDRVRAKGLAIIGATLLPRGKPLAVTTTPLGFSAAHEQVRLAVNDWIRTPGVFDAVIDFEPLFLGGGKAESGAEMIKPDFNCDYIHPNTAGYAAMGDFIDLSYFDL